MDNQKMTNGGEDDMNTVLEMQPKTLDCVIKMREMAQKAILGQGLKEKDVRKTLGIKKYEK